ncbi:MAG: hypothetical protein P4N59_06115 [Negativicutes bacterium]|nr:hypothetical protein [Negativicutes bacterium]
MATTATVISQTILETVLADVNAVVPNFSSLVSSYRLLVGAAEEIHRIPGTSPDVLARAIERFDRTGVLIDILVDLLCCKISFSSDFLAVTCAPVDLFRLLATRFDIANTPHEVAEEILLLEVLRRAEVALRGRDSASSPPCTPPGPPPYTFATSFYQPPAPPSAAFPSPVAPAECSTPSPTDSQPRTMQPDSLDPPPPQPPIAPVQATPAGSTDKESTPLPAPAEAKAAEEENHIAPAAPPRPSAGSRPRRLKI